MEIFRSKVIIFATFFMVLSAGCASVQSARQPAQANASLTEARQLYVDAVNCRTPVDTNSRRLKLNGALEILRKAYTDNSLTSQEKQQFKNLYDAYYNTLLELNDAGLNGRSFCQEKDGRVPASGPDEMASILLYRNEGKLYCPNPQTIAVLQAKFEETKKVAETFPVIGEGLRTNDRYRDLPIEIPQVILSAKSDDSGNILAHIGLTGSPDYNPMNELIRRKIGFKAAEMMIQSGSGCILSK